MMEYAILFTCDTPNGVLYEIDSACIFPYNIPLGDGINSVIAGQKIPDGDYTIERMLKSFVGRGYVAT